MTGLFWKKKYREDVLKKKKVSDPKDSKRAEGCIVKESYTHAHPLYLSPAILFC